MKDLSILVWAIILNVLWLGIYGLLLIVGGILVLCLLAIFKPEWLDKIF